MGTRRHRPAAAYRPASGLRLAATITASILGVAGFICGLFLSGNGSYGVIRRAMQAKQDAIRKFNEATKRAIEREEAKKRDEEIRRASDAMAQAAFRAKAEKRRKAANEDAAAGTTKAVPPEQEF